MPHVYRLHRRQTLSLFIDEAWALFSDPRNLEAITPDDLCFAIASDVPQAIYTGLIIEYRLTVPPGIRTGWLTEIKAVDPPYRFVDEQRYGPCALWYHEHSSRAVGGGVECEDTVHYRLPLGWLGRVAHWLFVQGQLERIFAHRRQVLEDRFGASGARTTPG